VQRTPQAPHAALLLVVGVSQPLAALASQSANPPAQLATVHCDMLHPAVPLATMHTRPQLPQWLVVLVVLVSQPLEAMPSQSANPAVQLNAQRPPVHAGTALSAAMHTVPQAPQCETLVVVLVSQPLLALSSQSSNPAEQAPMSHRPIVQAAVALARSQRVVQAPQRVGSLERLVSQPFVGSPSQSPKPSTQLEAQAPATQRAVVLGPAGQRVPQVPQWAGSLWVLASQPLVALLSQSAKGAEHTPTAHTPLRQAAMALATSQRVPHAPQDAMLLWVSRQAPSQHVCAEGQGRAEVQPVTHTLPTQSMPAAQ